MQKHYPSKTMQYQEFWGLFALRHFVFPITMVNGWFSLLVPTTLTVG